MEKFNELYNSSSRIIGMYYNAFYDSTCTTCKCMYDMSISWIKRLLQEEYNLINSMSLEEIETSLEKLSSIKSNGDSTELYRIKKKLLNHKDVLLNGSISSNMLGIIEISNDIEFGIDDFIEAMINIAVIKKVKNDIYKLKDNDNNEKFIKALKEELQSLEIDFICFNSIFEIIALYNEIKIDKIPDIDIRLIKRIRNKKVSKKFNNKIMIETKRVIDRLVNTTEFYKEDNPLHVFDYLVNITKLEVLLSCMDDDLKDSFYNYCSGIIDDTNSKSGEYVRNLIKSKVR